MNQTLISSSKASPLTSQKELIYNQNRRRELYSDVKLLTYQWETYHLGLFHFVVYALCAVCSYLSLVIFLPPIPQDPAVLASCGILAWSTYCIWMVGHESYHLTMTPSKLLNEVIGFITMDCIVTSKETWKITHKLHHEAPLATEPELDRQQLFGSCILTETFNIIYTILTYWVKDFGFLFKNPSATKLIALVIRLTIYLLLPANILVSFLFLLGMVSNYTALLTHAVPIMPKEQNKSSGSDSKHEKIIHEIRTSIDIFPQSHVVLFLFGGLNCHCIHHVLPTLPRSLHLSRSRKLSKLYPEEYRSINTVSQLVALFILRSEVFTTPVRMEDLPRKVKERGLLELFKKVILDVGSLFMIYLLVSLVSPVSIFH